MCVLFMHNITHGHQCKEKLSKQPSFSVNKDSVEFTNYLHKQDFVSVFLTQVSTSRGVREVRIFPNTYYVHRLRKLK